MEEYNTKTEMLFTVFTPTFNRESTINRVYQSLLAQTFRDFEWLIIDDGSTDMTEQLVRLWINEKKLNIRYYKQENTHKFFTILKASKLSRGKFLYTVDSDDEILPQALELLKKAWVSIPEDQRGTYSAVTGLCQDQHGKLIGDKYPYSPFDSDTLESTVKFKIKGEKSGFQLTSLLSEIEFKEDFRNKGYIPEGILWLTLANMGYKTRYINEVVRTYYVDAGESIMTTSSITKNSFGMFHFAKLFINSSQHLLFYNARSIIGQMRNYITSGYLENESAISMIKELNDASSKILFVLIWPIGYLNYKMNK